MDEEIIQDASKHLVDESGEFEEGDAVVVPSKGEVMEI